MFQSMVWLIAPTLTQKAIDYTLISGPRAIGSTGAYTRSLSNV